MSVETKDLHQAEVLSLHSARKHAYPKPLMRLVCNFIFHSIILFGALSRGQHGIHAKQGIRNGSNPQLLTSTFIEAVSFGFPFLLLRGAKHPAALRSTTIQTDVKIFHCLKHAQGVSVVEWKQKYCLKITIKNIQKKKK